MYKIIITNYFKKQLKPLVKKNRTLKEALKTILLNFNKEHSVSIGHGVYKTRLQGQNKGKSGGYRLYVFLIEINKILAPIAIYPKNQKENLTSNDLSNSLERVKDELAKLL